MERRSVVRAMCASVMVIGVAVSIGCHRSSAPAPVGRMTAIPAGCVVTVGDAAIPVVTKGYDKYDCAKWVGDYMGIPTIQVTQSMAQSGCADPRGADKAVVMTAMFANAGGLSDAGGGDYKTKEAFVVGTIRNDSPCDLKGKNLKLDAQTTYYIVVYSKGDKVYLIPPSDNKKQLKFVSCTDAGSPPPNGSSGAGDIGFVKVELDKCDHSHTPKFTPASTASDSAAYAAHGVLRGGIDDSGVLWLACAVDCCVAM